jgi:polyhydroxyalkanoate synthesis regulator phasin
MAGLFEKGMLVGLGLIDMSGEKLKEIVDELVERGEVSRKEGASVIKKAMARGARERKDLEKRLHDVAGKAIGKIDVATRKDVEKLEKKLVRLEEKLAALARQAVK